MSRTRWIRQRAEFQTQAIREKVEKYIEAGHPPCGAASGTQSKPALHLPVGVVAAVARASIVGWSLIQPATMGFVVEPPRGFNRDPAGGTLPHPCRLPAFLSPVPVQRGLRDLSASSWPSGIAVSGVILAVAITAAEPVFSFVQLQRNARRACAVAVDR
ncbi:MAG: hypothetical protein M5U25_11455 [Planctomycetota bacterium]|nr:hypothetical protein [Planctomycetota bacterium]